MPRSLATARNDDSNNLVVKNSTEIKKSECVLIGDSKYDAIGAEQAGIDFIGVTYGFGFKSSDNLNSFKYVGIANSVNELFTLLR